MKTEVDMVTVEEVRLDIDIPAFDRATMDGYAVVSSDGGCGRPCVI